jgi:hypothetical protein
MSKITTRWGKIEGNIEDQTDLIGLLSGESDKINILSGNLNTTSIISNNVYSTVESNSGQWNGTTDILPLCAIVTGNVEDIENLSGKIEYDYYVTSNDWNELVSVLESGTYKSIRIKGLYKCTDNEATPLNVHANVKLIEGDKAEIDLDGSNNNSITYFMRLDGPTVVKNINFTKYYRYFGIYGNTDPNSTTADTTPWVIGCKVNGDIVAGTTNNYAFSRVNAAYCVAKDNIVQGSLIGFQTCKHVVNCAVENAHIGYRGGTTYQTVSNCTSKNADIGFDSCKKVDGCVVRNTSVDTKIGFNNCDGLSICEAAYCDTGFKDCDYVDGNNIAYSNNNNFDSCLFTYNKKALSDIDNSVGLYDDISDLTADRTQIRQDKNGVVALTGDLNNYIPLLGSNNISGDLTPALTDTYSLGTSAQKWKDLYVTSGTIYFDENKVSLNSAGNLTFNGEQFVTVKSVESQNTSEAPLLSSLRVGTSEGEVLINKDGIRLKGSATCWRDSKFPFIGRNLDTSTGRLDFNYAECAIGMQDNCTVNDNQCIAMIDQINHEWKIGSIIKPHLHWLQSSSDIPNMLLKYRMYDNGEQVPSTWTSVAISSNAFTYTSGTILQLSRFPDIDTSTLTGVSCFIDFKIYRDTDNSSGLFAGNDPLVGKTLLKEFDVHYEVDGFGSEDEINKL